MTKAFKTSTEQERKSQVKARTMRLPDYMNPEVDLEEFKPYDGENAIRLVPPLQSDKHCDQFGMNLYIYYANGTSFVAPDTFDSTITNPMLAAFQKKKAEGASEKELNQYKGTFRTFVYVLDCNDDDKLKYWMMPYTCMGGILKSAKHRRSGELIPLEHPEYGRAIFFDKTGSGINTRYDGFILDDQPLPLSPDILDQMYEVRDVFLVPSVEEVQKHLEQLETPTFEEEEDSGEWSSGMAYEDEEQPAAQQDANLGEQLDDEVPWHQEAPQQPAQQTQAAPKARRATTRARKTSQAAAEQSAPAEQPADTGQGGDLRSRMAARRAALKAKNNQS